MESGKRHGLHDASSITGAGVSGSTEQVESGDLNKASPVQRRTKREMAPVRLDADKVVRHELDRFLAAEWGRASAWARRMEVDPAVVDHFTQEGHGAVTMRDIWAMSDSACIAYLEHMLTYRRGGRSAADGQPSIEELERKAQVSTAKVTVQLAEARADGVIDAPESRSIEHDARAAAAAHLELADNVRKLR